MRWRLEKALKNSQMEIETVKKNVADFLNKYSIKNKRVLIAFSGGNDSMCLLSVLSELKKEFNLELIAIHLNHNWRGEESLAEENHCRDFCTQNGVEFYSETLSDDVKHTETDAREARYDFFARCAQNFNTDIVFTAHNADDNAETLLYRFTKGTGIKGLCGIAPVRGMFYRPLLTTYRKDIEEYISSCGLVPNQDSSNMDDKYKRNFLRLKIIPELEKINKDFKKSLNTLSELACDSEEIISEILRGLDEPYKTRNFIKFSSALQKRIIYDLLIQNNFDYDYKTVSKLQDFILENANLKNGKTISINYGSFLFVSKDEIRVVRSNETECFEVKIDKEGVYEVGDHRLKIEKCTNKPEKFPPDSAGIAYADLSETGMNFTLRLRNEGDIIEPLGCGGVQKLKKYLSEKSIPKDRRDNLPLLCHGKEVLWVPTLGISDKIKVVDKPTHVLRLERKNG